MAKAGRKQKGWYKRDLLQEQPENKSFKYQGEHMIYGLVSSEAPFDLRYIGFTGMALNLRYNRHIGDSVEGKTKKDQWVKAVVDSGHQLIMVVMEDGIQTQREACQAERAYIRGFRDAGAELTNMTRGGIGVHGMHHSEETKEKQRQARIKKVAEKTVVQMAVHSIAA